MSILKKKINAQELMDKANARAEGLYKKSLERCVPITKEILKMIVDADLDIGDEKDIDVEKHNKLAEKILALMLEQDIMYTERTFLHQLALQPIDKVMSIVRTSLEKTFELANQKKWEVDDVNALQLSIIHKFLTEKP